MQADAEHLPLADECADLVVSEHGAPAWCEPEAWIGEAARILRPGGRLVFLTNSPLSAMCVPAEGGPAGEPAAARSGRSAHRSAGRVAAWSTIPATGSGSGCSVGHGFAIEGLHELHAPADHDPDQAAAGFYEIADLAWARQWPAEDLWSGHGCGSATPSG